MIKRLFFFVNFVLFISSFLIAQTEWTTSDFVGKWTASIPESRSKSMDMLFEGAVIYLKEDLSYTAKIMKDFEGTWSLADGQISLSPSDNTISEQFSTIVLTNLSKDSCTWSITKVKTSIPFYKSTTKASATKTEKNEFITVDNKEILLGRWINTNIEDSSKSQKANIALWGDSNMNDYLELNPAGDYYIARSLKNTNDSSNFNGTWSLEKDYVLLEDSSGKTAPEKLGILKATKDTLILMDINERNIGFAGVVKLKYTYTRNIAKGLKKYLFTTNAVETLTKKDLKVQLNVPEGFSGDLSYSMDGYTVMTFQLARCSWCSPLEKTLEGAKEDISSNGYFVRFLESDSDDFFLYEHKSITGDTWYKVKHIFSHNGEIYYFEIGSFLLENVHTMITSLKNKKILE